MRAPLSEYLFIVPQAHLRLFDYRLQVEMYDVFHRRWLTRIVHGVCSAFILTGSFVVLRALGHDADVVSAVVLLAWWARLRPGVALAALLPLGALLAAARLVGEALGPTAPTAGAWMIGGGTIIQAVSHLAEDMPPPWSGRHGWISMREALALSVPRHVAGLVVLLLSACVLELWAAYRVFPMQWWLNALRLGMCPEERERIRSRRAEIVADYRRGWPV